MSNNEIGLVGEQRRKFLKKVAVTSGVLGSGITGTTSATDDEFREKIIEANNLTRSKGPEARADFLESEGYPTGYVRGTFRPTTRDGPSSEKVGCVDPIQCDGDIDLTLSFSYNTYNHSYYAGVTMRMRYYYYTNQYGTFYGGGVPPKDVLGIQWERDHWKLKNRDDIPGSTTDSDNITWANGSWDFEGLAFNVDDETHCKSSGFTPIEESEWSDYETVGAFLEKGDDYEALDSVTASYAHTWSGVVYDIGVSFPAGISLTTGSNTQYKELQTDLDGDTLIVDESDV